MRSLDGAVARGAPTVGPSLTVSKGGVVATVGRAVRRKGLSPLEAPLAVVLVADALLRHVALVIGTFNLLGIVSQDSSPLFSEYTRSERAVQSRGDISNSEGSGGRAY